MRDRSEQAGDMKSSRGLFGMFDSLIDRILCVVGAILLSQGPEFMQQYLQRLGGHLDEARRQVAIYQHTADQSGVTLEHFVQQTAANADPSVARLGQVVQDSIKRETSLQAAHDALLHAAPWERPMVFLRHVDVSIARATVAVYKPAMPTTAEGLAYALSGMLLMLAFYHWGLKAVYRLLTRPSTPVQAAA